MDKRESRVKEFVGTLQKILVSDVIPRDNEEDRMKWATKCLLLARNLRQDESLSSETEQSLIPVGKSSRPGIWYMHLKDLKNNLDIRIRQVETEGKDLEKGILNFLVRAQNLLQLEHPAFAKTYAIVRHDPWVSVIGEYIEGMPFDNLVQEVEKSDLDTVVGAGIYLARALQRAAQVQAHHLNLTPGNIILDREGHLRIVDPSLKRLYSAAPALWKQESRSQPEWIPPEVQDQPDSGDARSDIFLLGKLLEYMSDHLLTQGDREMETLSDIINRATREDPNERYLSHTYLVRDLLSLLEREGSEFDSETPLFEFPTPENK